MMLLLPKEVSVNRDKLRQASLFVIHGIKYHTCGKMLGWISLNQRLFFHFAVASLAYVCFFSPF